MTAEDVSVAIRHGQEDEAIDALREHPEWINAYVKEAYGDGDMWPLITVAVVFRRQKVWRYLMEQGADIEARAEKYAATPLGFAVSCEVDAAVEDFVAAGAKQDLWIAAYRGDLELVRQLLKNDPDAIRRRDGADGACPLHYARGPEMVDLLIDHGADPNEEDDAHKAQPLVWHRARPLMQERLRARGAVPDLKTAVVIGDLDAVRAAWEKHSDQRDLITHGHYLGGGGTNLVGLAANNGNLEMVRWLLENGVTPNPKCPVSPLHSASWNDHPEIITLLAQHGGDMTKIDEYHDSTPIGWAAYAGRPAAIGALLAAGSPVTENALENARLGAQGKLMFSPGTPPAVYEECVALLEKAAANS
ncbi:MAG: ankyrin repeat domain-containing protein [Fimbriimonadaceae bacterium]|nr:ankyrin repeat domain-containing protein [Fimbriimonadaceae bacterium]